MSHPNHTGSYYNKKKNSSFGLFVRHDGTMTGATFWIIGIGLPVMFLLKQWFMGLTCVVFGFILALLDAMNDVKENAKITSRLESMHATRIVHEMKQVIANQINASTKDNYPSDSTCTDSMVFLLNCLEALANKMNFQKQNSECYHLDELELSCQEAAYVVLQHYPFECNPSEVMPVIATAVSIMALVAKNTAVRNRYRGDYSELSSQVSSLTVYQMKVTLQVMKSSLQWIQERQEEEALVENGVEDLNHEHDEILVADVQRRGCLWIGALADEDFEITSRLVDAGALRVILNALDWFRYHSHVTCWGLWAIFILCLDNEGHQMELIRHGGLIVICRSIRLNCAESVEVSRHGFGILFDLLRQRPVDQSLDATNSRTTMSLKLLEIRKMANAAGLKDAVLEAMDHHQDNLEIIGMGTEMLLSTGYDGDIPMYQPGE